MEAADPFDQAAEDYDAWFDDHPHAYQAELEAIHELIPKSGNGVEIGVGTGRFAAPLGIRLGIEPSDSMRRIAEDRDVATIKGHAEDLPLPGGSIDFALMVTTLCFLDDVPQAFREIHRVLRPGGAFILAFIDADSRLGKQYLERKDDSRFYRHAHFYSIKTVRAELLKAGFEDFELRQTIFRNPDQMTKPDPVRQGSGQGVFVVVRALSK